MSYSGEYNGIAKSAYGYSMLTNLCGAPKYPLGVQNVAPVYQVMGANPMVQTSVAYSGVSYKDGLFTSLFPSTQGSSHGHVEAEFAYGGAGGQNNTVKTFSVSRSAQ